MIENWNDKIDFGKFKGVNRASSKRTLMPQSAVDRTIHS